LFVVFGSARNVAVPLPEPLAPPVMLSQEVDSVEVQLHPPLAFTVKAAQRHEDADGEEERVEAIGTIETNCHR